MRRGPEKGYTSDAKEEYRKSVWGSFPDYVGEYCRDVKDCHVLLLPSKEGEEIRHAIAAGVPEGKIICVDENPALIAVSDWRKTYPKCKYYGCKVSEVGDKLKKDGGRLIAANLDLCNNFSSELIEEVSEFLCNTPVYEGFSFAITIAKGRENKATMALMSMADNSSDLRDEIEDKRTRLLVESVIRPINAIGYARVAAQGSYTHNKTPMAFIVISCLSSDEVNDAFAEMDAKSKDLCDAFDVAFSDDASNYVDGKRNKYLSSVYSSLREAYDSWDNAADEFSFPEGLINGPRLGDEYSFRSFINSHSDYMVRASEIQHKALKLINDSQYSR